MTKLFAILSTYRSPDLTSRITQYARCCSAEFKGRIYSCEMKNGYVSSRTLFSLKPTSYRPETSHALRKGFGPFMYLISFYSFTQQLRYELQKIGFAKNVASISRKIATLFKLETLEKQGHRVSFNRYIYDVGAEFLKKVSF